VSTLQQTPPLEVVAPVPSPAEPELIQREREVLHAILTLVAERAEAETEVEGHRASNDAAADLEYQRKRRELDEKVEGRKRRYRQEDEERRRAIVEAAMTGAAEAKAEFAKASRKIAAEFDSLRSRAKNNQARAQADAEAVYVASKKEAEARFLKAKAPIDDASQIIASMSDRLAILFDAYKKFGLAEPPPTPIPESYKFDDPTAVLFDRLTKIEPNLKLLEGLIIPRAMKGYRFLWLFPVIFLALVVFLVWGLEYDVLMGLGVAVAGAVVFGLLLRHGLYRLSQKQVSERYYPLFQSLVDAKALAGHCLALAEERLKQEHARAAQRRSDELKQAQETFTQTIAQGEADRDEKLRKINDRYTRRMVEIQTRQQTDMREAIATYERLQAELPILRETTLRKLDDRYRATKEKVQARYEEAWNDLAKRWREGIEQARRALDEVGREVDVIGPKWDDPSWPQRPFARVVPPVLRFGEVTLDLHRLPRGISADARLMEGLPTVFTFPALRAFPDRASLLIEAPGEARAVAIGVLQAAMFRLLTSLPPGRVRFTLIDPIGIGRNFGAFMHLADFDPSLVHDQVWTDPHQIEEQLADLAAHMEKVTQKYLRNEYATIEEYNAVAGEVAEPYRVLVIADFPTNLTEKAASRLTSIVAGGAPCGVLTLIAVDQDRPLPPGFALEDIRPYALNLLWEGGRLGWSDPDFGRYPLELEMPPPTDLATRLIQRLGAAARDARRVEVPFEFIAPPPEAWWTCDSRAGIDVALGKAGATKRQHLALGQGTSQHVLVAGRTGSGKSTLMHALITNLALNYSPDQIDLYLIDFKKGVEFKVYATHELPHASVVAIESEREFGISVLQRLDAEMRLRADRFREAGVQDLNGYRDEPGTPPLPRIMLIVDEFQEFFVEEDKIAQEAALLLDRLVRQGRAFGIHVLLGSQTLGGAYALARSTLGQIAVRIALQCSEADAHLILSETNTAARLLSRPGEAVYNDANGFVEGNHFFQVVWLGDDRREDYLKQLHALAQKRKPLLARTPIVFEGDAPAELPRNPLLTPLLDAPGWPASPRSAFAWLGDAVAIKDPTSALFRRQGGNHLLIVGQNEESALGVMTAALISLAAQYPPAASNTIRSGARFFLLDGTPEDHPRTEYLARVAGILPHTAAVGGWREAARIVATVATEVERRQGPEAADGPELFLFIHDLPRFRDLRRREDDFGLTRHGEDAGPSDHLGNILREGAALGVHILTWCDTLNNLQRVFDHQLLREFEMRVLFQMSPTDSGHLLDAPYASKLGPHRAFFASEEQNRLEKFRPYGPPAPEWLDGLRQRWSQRI
jgi:S-DNA-T family DNA segregation ATPase FtsK/SpoIIIE